VERKGLLLALKLNVIRHDKSSSVFCKVLDLVGMTVPSILNNEYKIIQYRK